MVDDVIIIIGSIFFLLLLVQEIMVHLTVEDVLDLIKYAPSPFTGKEMETQRV